MGTIWLGEHLDSMVMSFQFRSPGELVPEGGGEQRHMMYTYDVIGYTLDN
jgi:hypothetical protein